MKRLLLRSGLLCRRSLPLRREIAKLDIPSDISSLIKESQNEVVEAETQQVTKQEVLLPIQHPELKDVEQHLSVSQAMDMLRIEIESGRSSEVMCLLAAKHRTWSVKTKLSRDQPEPLYKRIWDTLTLKPYDDENEVHRLQELSARVAVLEDIELTLPKWQLVIRLVDPPQGVYWKEHALIHSYIDRTLEFSNGEECSLFVRRLARQLYQADHHPNWQFFVIPRAVEQKGTLLKIRLTTHSLQNNLSRKDIEIGQAIEKMYKQMKISSLGLIALRTKEALPVGALLWVALFSGVFGVLLLQNYLNYGTIKPLFYGLNRAQPIREYELSLAGQTIVARAQQRELTPLSAQVKEKQGELVIMRPDYQQNPQVAKVFGWDRGSEGYTADVQNFVESERGNFKSIQRKKEN